MTYLYYNNGQLKMMSESPIKTDMKCVERSLTSDEEMKIKDIFWEKKIENNELQFVKTPELITKEMNINKINQATTIKELKDIMVDLIK